MCVSLIASTSPFNSSSSSSLWSPCSSFCPSTSSSRMWSLNPLCNSAEDLDTLAENEPPTGYEPKEYHITEITEPYIQESTGENGSLNSHDLENDDYTIGKALSSPLFTQEREDEASRRQAYHSLDKSLLSSLSSSVGLVRTGRPVSDEFGSLISNVRENPRRDSGNEQIRILLQRLREQILADCTAEIRKTRIPDRLRQKKYSKV